MSSILREIGAIARCFESMSNIEFKPYGLSKNQYIYLVRICEQPGIIQEEILTQVKVDRSTASRAIEKLERDLLIHKKQQPGNLKNKALYPTEKGLEMYAFLQKEERYSNAAAVKGLSEQDQRQLMDLLQKVRVNVEPDWEFVKNGGTRPY